MSEITISILIATMPTRWGAFNKLHTEIIKQVKPYFENTPVYLGYTVVSDSSLKKIEILIDNSIQYNIGTKRNKLLQRATGKYIVFIDDDDHISPDYVSKILSACQTNADCIGISGIITTNGSDQRQWHISKDYGSWHTSPDGTYLRTPNHISPVKRELALQAGFPEVSFGEDAEYSRRLLPLLKTETKVEGNIYHYDYWQK